MSGHDHSDLLGAWALDAVDPSQREAVDAALRADAVLRAQGDELRHVVALLGEELAAAPPPNVRLSTLAAVRARGRRQSFDPSSPTAAYLHQADAAAAAFRSVPDDAWARRASPYEWNLHGLVAHLLQVERYFERTLGFARGAAQPGEIDHLQLGAAEIEGELQRSPRDTLADWRATVARITARLGELDDLDRSVTFHQWPLSLRSLFVARAFELWTHADDIRRALGESVAAPVPPDVAVMSDTSVRSLPLAIHVVSAHVPDGAVRVVLTGDGGGTWDLQLGAGGGELTTIVADVVDYCRLAARRFEPDTIPATIDGDRAVALDLLRAATIVAV